MSKEQSIEEQISPHFEALKQIALANNVPLIVSIGVGNRELITTLSVRKGDGLKPQVAAAILNDEPERAVALLLSSYALSGMGQDEE